MNTTQVIGIAVLTLGILLLVIGLNSSQAPVEQITETLTGRFSDATMWYLVCGGIAIATGAALAFLSRRA
jgi:hypothetical protein